MGMPEFHASHLCLIESWLCLFIRRPCFYRDLLFANPLAGVLHISGPIAPADSAFSQFGKKYYWRHPGLLDVCRSGPFNCQKAGDFHGFF
jgi:hypothetical protein